MGAKMSAGDKIGPRQITELSKTKGRSSQEFSEEFKTRQRSMTDVIFLFLFALFLIILGGLLIYCLWNGDIFRILNGYDDCGHVCGRKSGPVGLDEFCTDVSAKDKPYQIIVKRDDLSGIADRKCVSNCSDYPGYHSVFHRCLPIKETVERESFLNKLGITEFFSEVSRDFHLFWREFLYLCLISLGFSILLLILFRFMVGFVVWIVLIGGLLASIIASIILWLMWDTARKVAPEQKMLAVDSRKSTTYLAFAIATTITAIIVFLVIVIMRKRIQLVVQLFKEAGKALTAMPLLLLQPFWTFSSLIVVISLWFYFTLWVESSGFITMISPHTYRFEKDGWMKFTRWYNLFAMLWISQFVIGCQHMVIAGAVSDWYFTRNKSALRAPILKSTFTLIRYHLGSVALGSLIIAIVQYIRIILKVTEKYLKNHNGKCVSCLLKCCQCCLYCFEKIIKFLSRNAYIEVAMYGYSFCHAGQQAFKLLVTNALRVTAINSVGDFVLFLGKILVVTSTVLIGSKLLHDKDGLQHIWVPLTLVGMFAYFVAHCFMTVYEMAIDTIFLCFCEDCEQNDGITKPYYMSRGLMEFVENSKKAIEMLETTKHQRGAWQNNATIPTISENVKS